MRNWGQFGSLGQAGKSVYLHPSPVCHRQVRVQVHSFQMGPQTLQTLVFGALLATWARLQKMCTSIPHLSVADR